MRNPGYRQHEQSSLFSSLFSQSVERQELENFYPCACAYAYAYLIYSIKRCRWKHHYERNAAPNQNNAAFIRGL